MHGLFAKRAAGIARAASRGMPVAIMFAGTASMALSAEPEACELRMPGLTSAPGLDQDYQRAALFMRSRHLPTCYKSDLTPDEWEQILEFYQALPPGIFVEGDFFVASQCWTGDVTLGASGRAQPAHLTYSFPADGATWGNAGVGYGTGPNDLNTKLVGTFGAGNLDRGREYIRQSLASLAKWSGVSYDEVGDDNVAQNTSTVRVATRGDIRIGSYPMGQNGVLAYNVFPNSGGDMALNSSYFVAGVFNSSSSDFRYFRNTVSHEHGHGTGYIHVVPCNNTKLMEPAISLSFDMHTIDDIRGAQRNYGDRFAGNNSTATAKDFGDLTTPTVRSVIERYLSTNGTAGFNNTDEDWFRFTISTPQDVTISVDPVGGTYDNGQQSSGCTGSVSSINADQAGNLNFELRDAAGTTVLNTVAAQPAGGTETLTLPGMAPGTYTLRVFDVGPNANQILQLYDLTIRVGTSKAPPVAVAGLNKRVAANTACWFNGRVNSRTTEIGVTIPNPTGYDWDFDGDGVFEVNDNATPSRQYVSNGTHPVTLRVTDSNGLSATHTILVVVHGATMSVTGCNPGSGEQGTIVPVTISGTNLKNVTNASMITVSGAGVLVAGTPTPNFFGTAVSGVQFFVDPGAAIGPRDVKITNPDGTATGVGLFTVLPKSTGCKWDLDGDGKVCQSDLGILLAGYGTTYTQSDLGELLAQYNGGCGNPC